MCTQLEVVRRTTSGSSKHLSPGLIVLFIALGIFFIFATFCRCVETYQKEEREKMERKREITREVELEVQKALKRQRQTAGRQVQVASLQRPRPANMSGKASAIAFPEYKFFQGTAASRLDVSNFDRTLPSTPDFEDGFAHNGWNSSNTRTTDDPLPSNPDLLHSRTVTNDTTRLQVYPL